MITDLKISSDQTEDYHSLRKTGDYLFKQKKYNQATQNYYKKIIRLWPKYLPDLLLQFEKTILEDDSNVEIKTSLAELHSAEQSLDEAIDEYEDIIEQDPFNIGHYKQLSQLYLKTRNYERVIGVLHAPYLLKIYDEEMANMLAVAYIEFDKIKEAINVYLDLIEINGSKESYLRTLSDLYFRNDDYMEAALTAFKRVSANNNSLSDVTSFIENCYKKSLENQSIGELLVDLYIRGDKPDQAVNLLKLYIEPEIRSDKKEFFEERLRKIIKDFPDVPEGILLQAGFFYKTGLYSEAADSFWSLIKNPNFEKQSLDGLKSILEIYPEQLSVLQYLGEYYKTKGQTENALDFMRKMLDIDFSKSLAVIAQCKDLLESNPKNFYARLTMAEAYYKRENYNNCLEIARELIDKGENTLEAYQVLFNTLIAIKDFNSIRSDFENDKNKFLNRIEFYCLFQKIYTQELQLKKDFFKQKISSHAQDFNASLEYILSLIECQDADNALLYTQNLLKNEPNYQLYYLQGIIFMEMGQYYSAVGSFKKSLDNIFVESSPGYLEVLNKIALCYEIVAEIDKSLEYYRKILEIDYSRQEIKDKEQMLKNCPYLDVAGKSLILVARELDGKSPAAVFNRNILKRKHKESVDSSMGILKNNEAIDDIFKGKLNSSADLLDIAYKMDPAHKNILNNKGVILILQSDWLSAERIYDKIIKDKSALSAAALYNLAFIYTYQYHKYEESIKFIKKILEFDEQFYECYLLLGDIYYYLKDIKSALENWGKYKNSGLLPIIASKRMFETRYINLF
ncbi:MAG: hypothetical protein PHV30_02365 [Candidatus Margulisbacteria bacterium]|nr:hypothetical protein [Candidatus Margulisiibacteriota bacterium]